MPMRMTTSLRKISGFTEQEIRKNEKVLLNIFCEAGEECIIEAKNGGTYTDQTGNLRSSIGYVVLRDGKVYQQGQVDQTKDGKEGISEGKKYLEKRIKAAKQDGIMLIVTAGMNYAEYVETRRVVLSSAELKAPDIVRELLLGVGFKLK